MDAAITESSEEQSPEKPSQTIVELIAEHEGTTPTELSPALYSAIDPEALDALFSQSSAQKSETSNHIQFTYCGYEIHVEGSGDVDVSEL